jgi:hypothetical protein
MAREMALAALPGGAALGSGFCVLSGNVAASVAAVAVASAHAGRGGAAKRGVRVRLAAGAAALTWQRRSRRYAAWHGLATSQQLCGNARNGGIAAALRRRRQLKRTAATNGVAAARSRTA